MTSPLQTIRKALERQATGTFCFVCGAPDPQRIHTGEGEQFQCLHGHRSPRAYIFDGKTIHTFDGERLVHETVGAIVQRQAGSERQTLMFLRQKFPFQYTIPAGHLEVGQEPAAEAARELEEETGLATHQTSPLWSEAPPLLYDPCRRGADWHRWHVFQVEASGTPRLSDEGRIIGWYLDHEIQGFAEAGLLTRPVQVLLGRLGVIRVDSAEGQDF